MEPIYIVVCNGISTHVDSKMYDLAKRIAFKAQLAFNETDNSEIDKCRSFELNLDNYSAQ